MSTNDKPTGFITTLVSAEKVITINQGPQTVTITTRDKATGKVETKTFNGVVLRKL
jgi:hypothetical protein